MKYFYKLSVFLLILLGSNILLFSQKPHQDSLKKKKDYGEIYLNIGSPLFAGNSLTELVNNLNTSINIGINYRNKIYKRFDYLVYAKIANENTLPSNVSYNKDALNKYVVENNIYYPNQLKDKLLFNLGANILYSLQNNPTFRWDLYTGIGLNLYSETGYIFFNRPELQVESDFYKINNIFKINTNFGTNFLFTIKKHFLLGFNLEYFLVTEPVSTKHDFLTFSDGTETNLSNFNFNLLLGYKF